MNSIRIYSLLFFLCAAQLAMSQVSSDSTKMRRDTVFLKGEKGDIEKQLRQVLSRTGKDSSTSINADTVVQNTLRKVEGVLNGGDMTELDWSMKGKSVRDSKSLLRADSLITPSGFTVDSSFLKNSILEKQLFGDRTLDQLLDQPQNLLRSRLNDYPQSLSEHSNALGENRPGDSLVTSKLNALEGKLPEDSALLSRFKPLEGKVETAEANLGQYAALENELKGAEVADLKKNRKRFKNLSQQHPDLESKVRSSPSVAKVGERYLRLESTASYAERRFKNKYLNSHLYDRRAVQDSLQEIQEKTNEQLSAYEGYQAPSVSMYTVKDSVAHQLDSLAPKLPLREKIVNKSDSIRSIVYAKRTFLNLDYFKEFILGVFPSGEQQVTLSPMIGVSISPTFDVGLGPTIHLMYDDKLRKDISVRSFARWHALPMFYAQAESTHYIRQWSNASFENASESSQSNVPSLAAGIGFMPPLTQKLGMVVQVLYEIVDGGRDTQESPWIIRFGINY